MNTRGQTSIEFIVLLGFMLIVFLSFFIVVQSYIASAYASQIREELVEVAQMVENELLLANQVQSDYSRQLLLPSQIANDPFVVQIIDETELIVSTTNYEYLIFLPFTVTVIPSGDSILSQDVVFKNSSGVYIFS